MDVRTRHDTPRALILALILAVPAFLGGCAATPVTMFAWGVRDSFHHRTRVATKQEYRDRSAAVPRPRPAPAWYRNDTHPAPRVADNDDNDRNTPRPDAQFAWPVNGRLLSNFGSAAGGERNDGINIAASTGEPIHASADGTVSYAGNDLKSYGNLVLIKHDGNYVTAYAHCERMLVNRGDRVAKGQVIATAGSTGDVNEPQLHFEIRRGITPVDPRPLLRPLQVASR
ncbi:MAG: M23 family metallopeptidase [Alphaproteobacteria bacterium]|nr:M23 family metallopeptidase [Alphaproteobacteria bacterium]MDE2631046.1 M23 family metallopeptidase [Alphaproteobacteria bacterium]